MTVPSTGNGPIIISGKKDEDTLNTIITKSKPKSLTKRTFIFEEGTREGFREKLSEKEETGDLLKYGVYGTAFTAGILGGCAGGIVAAAAAGSAVAIGMAAMATPIGWAALGILAIGVTLLAVRHAYLSRHNINPKTLETGGIASVIGVGSALVALIVGLYIFGNQGGGGSCNVNMCHNHNSFSNGFLLGAMLYSKDTNSYTLTLNDSSSKDYDEPIYLFEGDQYEVEKQDNGDTIITIIPKKPEKER